MKKFLRHPAVQATLGFILGLWLIIIHRTVRWTHENLEPCQADFDGTRGAIALIWHGRLPICLGVGHMWRKRARNCLISPSGDGEFIAQALAMSGYGAIRTSSAKKGDSAKARAVVASFRAALSWVEGGGVLLATPDGPRGPNERIAPGSLQIAKRTGAPTYLMGTAVSPCGRLDTWDKVMVGVPFGRGATVWDGPLYVPADADDAMIEALVEDWSARLSAATRRAEVLVGLKPD